MEGIELVTTPDPAKLLADNKVTTESAWTLASHSRQIRPPKRKGSISNKEDVKKV